MQSMVGRILSAAVVFVLHKICVFMPTLQTVFLL